MGPLSQQQALIRLRALYRSTHDDLAPTNEELILFANSPHVWAEAIIRHGGWSFAAAEACVRSARILRKRALAALELEQA